MFNLQPITRFRSNKAIGSISLIMILFVISFYAVCRGTEKNVANSIIAIDSSSISIVLDPRQKFELASDFDKIYIFQNDSDTIQTVVKNFSFDKIKEFRTINANFPEILIFQPKSNIEFTIVNNKLYPKNNSAKQSIATEYLKTIGYKYIMDFVGNHKKTDTASHFSFLNERKLEMESNIKKIEGLIAAEKLDKINGKSLMLMTQITYASIVLNCIDYNWLQIHKPEIFEKYYSMLNQINSISGETVSFTLSNLSWYWAKMHQNERLSWVDFYLQNKENLGRTTVGKAFFDYIKNASNVHRKTLLYKDNLQKIVRYAKINDSTLFKFISSTTRPIISNLNHFFLQKNSGQIIKLAEAFKATKKKYILIDFWASWCKPCRIQTPHLRAMKEELGQYNIAIIGISIDDQMTAWQNALVEDDLNNDVFQFRIIRDDQKYDVFNSFFGLNIIPRYVVLNTEGKVLLYKTDFTPKEEEFRAEILKSILD